jgi:glycerol uptake facilitator protein
MGQFQMKIAPTWGDLKVEYRRALIGELISEALAVAIIILIGDGAAAMITLYDPSPYAQAYWGVCIAWGLGVTIAIYVTGAVSGTHANPAVTLALAFSVVSPNARFCLIG